MPFDIHTVEVPDGATLNNSDRVILGTKLAIANAAGGSAGASVSTAVSFPGLPPTFYVDVSPSQACFFVVTSKTTNGFTVVQTPTSGSVTLAAGTFDALVTG
jgi:hypothetical protein